ncbi:hypothetical protein Lalb_Chr02g0143511 [Lupinus albus]|uniref:Uncharacterized protein n=1 Tax=Lupinus albus TaxID=3870 RepID=A0A6A4QXI1_LUPAL|nr:hypothetical protein Lalb_Chr02g0143511 [Lupinus albus]
MEEMVEENVSSSYTSLSDIMEDHDPNNVSWLELPIKNQLLKCAASAYLRPISMPSPVPNKGFIYSFAAFFNTLLDPFIHCLSLTTRLGCTQKEMDQNSEA